MKLSVIIPTHSPKREILIRALCSLRGQTLPKKESELLLIDNSSQSPLRANLIAWHPRSRVIREDKLGLTYARVRGFAEAKGEIVVMVDDDNVLRPDYLEKAVEIMGKNPLLGAIGGKALPEYETEPPEWLKGIRSGLGLRDLGNSIILYPDVSKQGEAEKGIGDCGLGIGGKRSEVGSQMSEEQGEVEGGRWKVEGGPSFAPNLAGSVGASEGLKTGRVKRKMTEFPDCAPIGAGMVLKREAALEYVARIKEILGEGVAGGGSRVAGPSSLQASPTREELRRVLGSDAKKAVVTDRKGKSLSSGGDNDICLTVLEHGWQVGYFPELKLTHLIPKERMTVEYQCRMARDAMRSYIVMLDQHGIRPWPAMSRWTLPVRLVRCWWRTKPWKGIRERLSFENAMGQFLGRGDIYR